MNTTDIAPQNPMYPQRSTTWSGLREAGQSDSPTIRNHAAFIWAVADLLRGDYKPYEYGKVILPLVVLRGLDSVLAATKPQVLERHKSLVGRIENIEPVLQAAAGQQFFNTSALDFRRLHDGPTNLADSMSAWRPYFTSRHHRTFPPLRLYQSSDHIARSAECLRTPASRRRGLPSRSQRHRRYVDMAEGPAEAHPSIDTLPRRGCPALCIQQ